MAWKLHKKKEKQAEIRWERNCDERGNTGEKTRRRETKDHLGC